MHTIDIVDLTKDYGQGRGVFDVSFYVNKGECFGFLGPNGAGKSTTIRHLMGFSMPDKGHTYINGQDTRYNRDIIFQNVAYVPGEVVLPRNLKGTEVVKEQRQLKGVHDDKLYKELKDYFRLDPNLICKEMDLGRKRKRAIVCAFRSNPDIIILDEPSSGLDPERQDKFVDFILDLKKKGKTILLSSHIFSEVDACCDRIAVIKDGKIVSQILADSLKHKTEKKYVLTYANRKNRKNANERLLQEGFKVTESEKEPVLMVDADDKDINKLLCNRNREGRTDFKEIKETLEDYFMSFYKEDLDYGGIK